MFSHPVIPLPSWRSFFHMLFVHLRHFFFESAWATTLNRKKNYVQTIPGRMGHCLHEIEEISTLLAGSTRVSRRVTRQGGLTRLDYRFRVNAYKHLTAKGLPAAVIQHGVKSNPGSCKEAFLRRGRQPEENISRARTVMSPKFLY